MNNETYKIVSEFLKDAESEEIFESEVVVWIDWREEDESIVKYFNDKIGNKISLQLENNGKDYGDDIVLTYKENTTKIPYQDEMDRDTTIKWLNEIIKDDFSIRLFTSTIGSDTLGFVLLKNDEWSALEKEVGQNKLEHYFAPINLDSEIFNLDFNVVMDYLEITSMNEDVAFKTLINYTSISAKLYTLEQQKEDGEIDLKTYMLSKKELKEEKEKFAIENKITLA